MALKLKTPPAVDPVSLEEAKKHCRVDWNDDDALIGLYIKAATAHCDGNRGVLGRAIVNQQWELYYDAFPCGPMQIPLGPLVSVDSVEYVDATTGLYVTWAGTNYAVDLASFEGWISPVDAWPTPRETMNAVRVTFTAGHGADVPADIKAMLLMLIGHWYQNREAVVVGSPANSMPLTFESLLTTIRKITI